MTVRRGDPDIDQCKRGGIPSRLDGLLFECQSFSGSVMSRIGVECAELTSRITVVNSLSRKRVSTRAGLTTVWDQKGFEINRNDKRRLKIMNRIKKMNGPIGGRASGDPPALPNVRGHPLLLFSSRDDPPIRNLTGLKITGEVCPDGTKGRTCELANLRWVRET